MTAASGGRASAGRWLPRLCAAVFAATAVRLDAERALSQYVRDRWATETGFPGGPVYAITQTGDGYLWIGAEKGLVRFDGLTFRLFEPKAATGSAGPTVLGVATAPDGSLWARLRGIALVRHHNGAFQNILTDVGVPESVVSAMQRGRDDTMLLATLDRGAVIYRGGRFERSGSRGRRTNVVVRDLDGSRERRGNLARHAGRRPAPRAGIAGHATDRWTPRSENQLPARR